MGYIWVMYGLNMGYIKNKCRPYMDQRYTGCTPKALR